MRDLFWPFCCYCSLVFYIFGAFFNKTIIPLALVGYEMIIANSALCASLVIISYPTRAHGIIFNYMYNVHEFAYTSKRLIDLAYGRSQISGGLQKIDNENSKNTLKYILKNKLLCCTYLLLLRPQPGSKVGTNNSLFFHHELELISINTLYTILPYHDVEFMKTSLNQTLASYLPDRRCFFHVVLGLTKARQHCYIM